MLFALIGIPIVHSIVIAVIFEAMIVFFSLYEVISATLMEMTLHFFLVQLIFFSLKSYH